MSKNMERFAAIMSNRMKQTSGAAIPTTIELGKVNQNLSISTDSLLTPIPKGDYMVNLMLSGTFSTNDASHSHSGGAHGGHDGGDGSHSHSGGVHSHSIRGIKPGDRILVAWCGYEPVVIAVLDSSVKLTYSEADSPSEDGPDDSGSSGTGSGGSGSPGAGNTGGAGADGFSPTVTVTQIAGGNRVTITDVNGENTFDVMDGVTPVKGKDYFTAAEVEAIVEETVKRVTAIFAEKYYSKEELDEKIVTADDFTKMLGEVFGGNE